MRITLPLTLVLCLAPLAAQKTGSTNRNAPTVTTSVIVGKTKAAEVTYFALTTAQGKTLKRLMDKENGQGMRNYFNKKAQETPVGSLTIASSADIEGQRLRRGAYDLRFHIDNDCNWSITLTPKKGDGDAVKLPLKPNSSQMQTKRLVINLIPGDEPTGGVMAIHFGGLSARFKMAKAQRRKN